MQVVESLALVVRSGIEWSALVVGLAFVVVVAFVLLSMIGGALLPAPRPLPVPQSVSGTPKVTVRSPEPRKVVVAEPTPVEPAAGPIGDPTHPLWNQISGDADTLVELLDEEVPGTTVSLAAVVTGLVDAPSGGYEVEVVDRMGKKTRIALDPRSLMVLPRQHDAVRLTGEVLSGGQTRLLARDWEIVQVAA